jgi:hypothetical protein
MHCVVLHRSSHRLVADSGQLQEHREMRALSTGRHCDRRVRAMIGLPRVAAIGFMLWLSVVTTPARAQSAGSQSEPATPPSPDAEVGWGSESGPAQPTPSAASDDAAGWGDAAAAAPSGPAPAAAEAPESPAKLHANGRFQFSNGWWARRFADYPLAQLRALLELEARYSDNFEVHHTPASLRLVGKVHGEYDAAYLIDRDRYDQPTLDAYEHKLYLGQTYAALSIGSVALAVGKQLVPLGQGEVFSLLDTLNPRDLREPALTAIEDMRLAVMMSRLSLTLGGWMLEGFVVHEASPGLLPPPMGDFSPFRKLVMDNALAGEALSQKTWYLRGVPDDWRYQSWQYLGRVAYAGDGVDLEFIGGSVLDPYGVPKFPQPAQLAAQDLTLELYRPRYTLLGMSGAWAIGEILIRWEFAGALQRPQATIRTDTNLLQIGGIRRDQVGGLLGLTYFGLPHVNIGLEVQKAYVFDRPTAQNDGFVLLWPVERWSAALRWMQDFAGEAVQLNLMAGVIGLDHFNGGFIRAELAYNAGAGVRISGLYVKYLAGQEFGPFYGFEDNDRIQLVLRWDFVLS